MKQQAQALRALLIADGSVTAIASQRIYWETGDEDEQVPMAVFSIVEDLPQSKDRRNFDAVIRCFGQDLDEASDLYEAIREVLVNNNCYPERGQSGISDDERREGVIELNVKLKL